MINLGIIGPETSPGQLGMMLAWEANKLHCSGEALFHVQTIGSQSSPDWSDEHFAISEKEHFLQKANIITYETESLSESFRNAFSVKLNPSLEALSNFRNRHSEKLFFQKMGFKTAPFFLVDSHDSLIIAFNWMDEQTGKSFRLKTCEFGYDGHGQKCLSKPEELSSAWQSLDTLPCVLEEEISIFRELSIISTRYGNKQFIHFPLAENIHKNGILYRSKSAKVSKKIQTQLQKISEKILNHLNYVGTFALETFQLNGASGEILLNEAAPRVHNSGHYTLNYCEGTNQFDAHIRAICGLEMIQPQSKFAHFSMTNLLGIKETDYDQLLAELNYFVDNEVKVCPYWYGKVEARPGRKMGHITLLSNDLQLLVKTEEFLDDGIQKIKK